MPDRDSTPREPIRVLWLIKGLGPGGAEQLLVNHARVRDRDAFCVEAAYIVPAKNALVPALQDELIEVALLGGARRWDPRFIVRLRRLVRAHRIEVIHVHSPLVAVATRLVLRTMPRTRRPALISTEHNRWPRHHPVTRFLNRITFRLDDAHVAVSQDVRDSITAHAGPEVEVVIHGVDLATVRAGAEHAAAKRAELGIGTEELVIGTVANLRREKSWNVLLAAANRTLAATPDVAVRFVGVGQGPLEAEVCRQHDELELGERFLQLGYRPDATQITAVFDVFTLASTHEGLPVALMDALALGIAVVATRVGGIPEAVDGDAALLVPPNDPDALAQAFIRMVREPETRTRLAAGAAVAGNRFDIRNAVDVLEDRYRSLARARSRS